MDLAFVEVFERNGNSVNEISATSGTAASSATCKLNYMWLASGQTRSANKRTTTTEETTTATEQLAEKILRVDTTTHATFLETGFTELVVERSLLVVGKDFVTGFVVSTPCSMPLLQDCAYAWVISLKSSGSPPLSGWCFKALCGSVSYTLHKGLCGH